MAGFGNELARLRKAANLSQADLAHRIGVSDTYISAIETGRKAAPPHVHIQGIALCLGIDEDSLWRLALEDREMRLRERLAGIPTARRVVTGVGQERHPAQLGSTLAQNQPSSADLAARIERLLPTQSDRDRFASTLEILERILKGDD